MLGDLTALSTIKLHISEVQAFVPEESPSFGTLIARTWHDSLGRMQSLGQGLVLLLVGLAPWMMALVLPVGLIWRPFRRRLGRS